MLWLIAAVNGFVSNFASTLIPASAPLPSRYPCPIKCAACIYRPIPLRRRHLIFTPSLPANLPSVGAAADVIVVHMPPIALLK